MSVNREVEIEEEFRGPRPILHPQRPPPPPPTQLDSPVPLEATKSSSSETQEKNSSNIETTPTPTLLFQFNDLFEKFDYECVRKRILDRGLTQCPFTTVLWRLFLHCLPSESSKWPMAMNESRSNYEDLAERYIINRQKLSQKMRMNEDDDHPLSQKEDSLWSQAHQYRELRENIDQDVKRIFPELPFFREQRIRNLLSKILFIHARKHESSLPYRQGMHEILAVILHCLVSESVRVHEYPESSELMKNLYDEKYLEHDAYAIYEKIVEHLRQFYDFKTEKSYESRALPSAKGNPFIVERSDTASRVNSIIQRLADINRNLYAKLKQLDIDPSIYALRWLRLLFGREVPFESIPDLWTVIFCFDGYFGFTDYFFLALLIERAESFLKQSHANFSACVQILLQHDVVSNTEEIIQKALDLANQQTLLAPHRSDVSPSVRLPEDSSNPFQNDRANGNRSKETTFFGFIPNRLTPNETPKPTSPGASSQFNPMIGASKALSSKKSREAELEACPGGIIREQLAENIEMQTMSAGYMHQYLAKLRRGFAQNSLGEMDQICCYLNGLEQIANALIGISQLDENNLQKLLESTDDVKKTAEDNHQED